MDFTEDNQHWLVSILCIVTWMNQNLKFELSIRLSLKVLALGCGREHLMDAISQCEQDVKRRGGQEQHTPWRVSFRKEIFTPWHDCKEDKTSTQLIYKQIIHGLKFGEYQCPRVSI